MQRLWALKMAEGQDMAQHLNQFRELANQLRSLSPEGKGLDDSELVTILTLSLPDSYEPLVMALQSRTDQTTFDVMAGRLLQESARRHVGQIFHKTQDNGITASSQTAFAANRNQPNYPVSSARPVSQVYGRGRGGFRARFRGRSGGSTASSKIRSTVGTKCHYCGKEGHWKKDCFKRKSEEGGSGTTMGSREFTFLAKNTPAIPGMGWIIDSGASQHLCGSQEAFSNYTDVRAEQAITIADGTKIQAKGIGEITVATEAGSITLTDVWHIPDIGGNLLSVSRIVDAGYQVEFGHTTCTISQNGIRTKLGERLGRLYYLVQGLDTEIGDARVEANIGRTTN